MHWISQIEGGPRRVNHAAVAVGHKIYSFGGYCTGENSREYISMDVHVLNTTTFRWTKHPVSDLPYFEYDDILPYKRYGHTAVVYGDRIYIWGGRNDRSSCSVLFCFDTAWHCWTAPKTTGQLPPARDGHSACIWKHFMIIFGGYEEDNDEFSRTVYCLNLETMHWTYIHTVGPEPSTRDFHTTVVCDDKMFVFGGRGPVMDYIDDLDLTLLQEIYSNQIWYLDLHTMDWHRPVMTGDIPIGRRSHSAFIYNNKMYIFGGYNAIQRRHLNDMYEFDPVSYHWRKIKPHGEQPVERRRQACVMVGDRMFLFGGTSPQPIFHEELQLQEGDVDKLRDHSDMHVLDFRPSLRTLCILAVRKYRLDESSLPKNCRLSIQNMFAPNKVTNCRPNNSAG